jgi:shikimate dehydrogenase
MKAGLIGYPIEHSLSPAIHNAAYAALGLDWNYALYPCEDAAAFARTIAEAQKAPDAFVGFNVTTPYKTDAYEACAERSAFSEVTGSVNVLTLSTGAPAACFHLRGDNTDGRGLVASLEREGGLSVADASVVLCGTGPVALSALLALIESKAARVSIVSRDVQRGSERLRLLNARLNRERLRVAAGRADAEPDAPDGTAQAGDAPDKQAVSGALAWAKDVPDEPSAPSVLPETRLVSYGDVASCLETADLLIDATSVGMGSADEAVVPLETLRPGLVVLDVVYGHGETALIKGARERGAVAIDGLGMLVEQAALTIEIWARAQGTPVEPPRPLMHQLAREATTHHRSLEEAARPH